MLCWDFRLGGEQFAGVKGIGHEKKKKILRAILCIIYVVHELPLHMLSASHTITAAHVVCFPYNYSCTCCLLPIQLQLHMLYDSHTITAAHIVCFTYNYSCTCYLLHIQLQLHMLSDSNTITDAHVVCFPYNYCYTCCMIPILLPLHIKVTD